MQTTSNTCPLTLLWQRPCELLCTLWNSSLQPAHFMFTLGWKRLCQNIKDHSLHGINILYLLSEDKSLHFSWFCISGFGVFFFSSWESYVETMKLFFFKVIYPYNDCLGKTTEMWMLCLVSESCSILSSFSRIIGI